MAETTPDPDDVYDALLRGSSKVEDTDRLFVGPYVDAHYLNGAGSGGGAVLGAPHRMDVFKIFGSIVMELICASGQRDTVQQEETPYGSRNVYLRETHLPFFEKALSMLPERILRALSVNWKTLMFSLLNQEESTESRAALFADIPGGSTELADAGADEGLRCSVLQNRENSFYWVFKAEYEKALADVVGNATAAPCSAVAMTAYQKAKMVYCARRRAKVEKAAAKAEVKASKAAAKAAAKAEKAAAREEAARRKAAAAAPSSRATKGRKRPAPSVAPLRSSVGVAVADDDAAVA